MFTKEKNLPDRGNLTRKNYRVFAQSSRDECELFRHYEKGHHPASVMVKWSDSYDDVTDMHFCEHEFKTSTKVYQETVLETT